jgi:hypothetical protein
VTGFALTVALALLSIGVWRDLSRSERHGRRPGPLGGTLRPVSRQGLRAGLPFYILGALLLLAVAFR